MLIKWFYFKFSFSVVDWAEPTMPNRLLEKSNLRESLPFPRSLSSFVENSDSIRLFHPLVWQSQILFFSSLKLCGKLRTNSDFSSYYFSESNFVLFVYPLVGKSDSDSIDGKIRCYVMLFLKIIMWNYRTVFDVINNLGDRKDKKNPCFIFEWVFNSFIYLFG